MESMTMALGGGGSSIILRFLESHLPEEEGFLRMMLIQMSSCSITYSNWVILALSLTSAPGHLALDEYLGPSNWPEGFRRAPSFVNELITKH